MFDTGRYIRSSEAKKSKQPIRCGHIGGRKAQSSVNDGVLERDTLPNWQILSIFCRQPMWDLAVRVKTGRWGDAAEAKVASEPLHGGSARWISTRTCSLKQDSPAPISQERMYELQHPTS